MNLGTECPSVQLILQTLQSVSMSESLASIKSNIALFTRDVSGLQGEERAGAVSYIRDTINLLRLGAEQQSPPKKIR